jgi:hypothetical protein
LATSITSAQSGNTDTIKRVRINEASMSFSALLQMDPRGTLEDFKEIAPGSEILKKDLSTYSNPNAITFDMQSSLSGKIGILFTDKKGNSYKSHPLLRMGFAYRKSSSLNSQLSKRTVTRLDTLTSSQGSAPVYVDSVNHRNIGMRYEAEELRLDISIVFSTDPAMRWKLYGGLGLTAGGSLNAYTTISESEYRFNELSTSSSGNLIGSDRSISEHNYERLRNANSFGYSFYVPVGIDLRLGNKRAFWKRLHVFYEAKPFFNSYNIKELRQIKNVGFESSLGGLIRF